MDFQSQLSDTQAQVERLNSQLSSEREKFEQVAGECTTYRDIVTARTSAMTVSVIYTFCTGCDQQQSICYYGEIFYTVGICYLSNVHMFR